MSDYDVTIIGSGSSGRVAAARLERVRVPGMNLRFLAPPVLFLALAGCVSNSPPQAPVSREPSDPVVHAAGLKIVGRTFFAGSEGNLKGSIYFGPGRQALQVAPERGIRHLRWGIVKNAEGLNGPAVCVSGDYYNIAPASSTVTVQKNGVTGLCAPVSVFARIRSSQGNTLGLGTIIQ